MDDRNTIIALRKEGVGPREIARRLDCSPNRISGILNRAGLQVSDPHEGGRGNGPTPEFKAEAAAYGLAHGYVAAQERYGFSAGVICKWAGVRQRRPHTRRKRNG